MTLVVIYNQLSHYADLVTRRVPFSFVRYGDGEWLAILGACGHSNSNGCVFTHQVSVALQETIKRQSPYYHATTRIKANKVNGKKYGMDAIKEWLSDNNITMPWYWSRVFLLGSLRGELFPFIQSLRERRILYVGNERLRGLNKAGFFDYVDYKEPPPVNAFEAKDEILHYVYNSIEKHAVDFIGWSSGIATKYFIEQVYQRYPEVTQVDFGSAFDGYFEPLPHIKAKPKNNTGSRSFIRNGEYDFAELLLKNTGRM